jgi:uncharacterized protein
LDQENFSVIETVKAPASPGREFAWTWIVGAGVIAFLVYYQYVWDSRSFEEYIAVTTGVLLFLPLLAILLAMRSSPETFGMTAGDSRLARRYGVGLLVLMIPVLFISSRTQGAMDYYPLFRRYPQAYEPSWAYLLYFEALYGAYLFAWEWFFRGFLLFGLARGMGSWSLFAQAIPFGLLHYGKPWPEFLGSFVAAVVLGFVALRTGSFLTGFVVHWAVAILYDLFVILALASAGTRLF